MKELTRRSFLKYAGVSGLGVASMTALAACGGKSDSAAAPAATQAAAPTEMQIGEKAGEIKAEEGTEFVELDSGVMGTILLFSTLTPFRNTSMQRGVIVRYLFDRLAYLNDMGEYLPQGAKSWKVADDGVTWTIELYDYITDSMGNAITADDVIWFINKSNELNTKPCFKKIKNLEKIDDYTLTIEMNKDIADAFQIILESTFLISQKSFEASKDEMKTDVISASPYVVTDYQPDNSLTWTKRNDYWQKEELIDKSMAANLKQVTQILITEASQQQIALETGTIDCMPGIRATLIDAFTNNPDFLVCMTPANNGSDLLFSGDESRIIGRDENLRKAICHAIDVDGLIQAVCKGYAEKSWDFIPRTSGGFQESWIGQPYFDYDVELAKEYLAKSSYNGEEINFYCTTGNDAALIIIQAYCQVIGVNIKINVVDNALWTSISNDGREWDMCIAQTGNGGANMWSQFIDGDIYEYGDAMARKDAELTELVHYTWQNANYTPENINKVHEHLTEHAYIYGLYLAYALSVVSTKLNIAETAFNNQGWLDLAACKFKKV